MSNDLGNGIAQLTSKRQRRTRQPLPSRHPVTAAPASAEAPAPVETSAATPAIEPTVAPPPRPADTAAETAVTPQVPAETPAAPVAAPSTKTVGGATLPKLDIDLTDAAAHIVSPTQLSIPTSIVTRFDKARAGASSHTALVIDALRENAERLPDLILGRRPGLKAGDLFPFRAAVEKTEAETPMPLRIRPTRGELDIMEKLVNWANEVIAKQRPGAKKTNRSEMVAAALDAHLPPGA